MDQGQLTQRSKLLITELSTMSRSFDRVGCHAIGHTFRLRLHLKTICQFNEVSVDREVINHAWFLEKVFRNHAWLRRRKEKKTAVLCYHDTDINPVMKCLKFGGVNFSFLSYVSSKKEESIDWWPLIFIFRSDFSF